MTKFSPHDDNTRFYGSTLKFCDNSSAFQKFGGEIISADAMQMYQGLNIVTNKVRPFSLFLRTVLLVHVTYCMFKSTSII